MKLNKVYGVLLAGLIVVAAPVYAQQPDMGKTNHDSDKMNMNMDKDMNKGMNMDMGADSMKNMPRQGNMSAPAMQKQMNDQSQHSMNPGAGMPKDNKQ
ncbi:hypothetical protein CAP31_05035 [Sulfuriferula sp. AH1]|uniref:hypothetical protein n=1 Tax=Sulfuriferula sp. AH1 TaxID=1985873 RepID=UPI000B3BA1D5|nr:hypothetical protein [Sulfuriferula sp. AH1]ARU31106.1 hypothetical protein CAP31_05035 [Sulfuriferula sp. AH1]